jgi:hypothetical protein
MVPVVRVQLLADPVQPLVELGARARVQRREGAHHARLALGDDEVRIGDDEQGRRHHGQAEAVAKDRR